MPLGIRIRRGSAHFFFQAEDGIRDADVTGVQTCALPICRAGADRRAGNHSGRRANLRPGHRQPRPLPGSSADAGQGTAMLGGVCQPRQKPGQPLPPSTGPGRYAVSKVLLALSLATASLWYRRKVLALVCLTLTLSVTLLLGIQYLRTEVRQSFTSTISGTDLIVGARSGQLNLLLYSVFHIGDATNNIRWSTYQKLAQDKRIDWVVPVSLGDSYRGYRVVSTNAQFVERFRYGNDQPLELAAGHWFTDLFDVVLGAGVARQLNHQTDDSVVLSHGGGRTSFANHTNLPFRVSGILAPTGTPVDQAV